MNFAGQRQIVHRKNGERFVFWVDDDPESWLTLRRLVGELAARPDLAFDWHDAAAVVQQAQKLQAAGRSSPA